MIVLYALTSSHFYQAIILSELFPFVPVLLDQLVKYVSNKAYINKILPDYSKRELESQLLVVFSFCLVDDSLSVGKQGFGQM
jgi:hypothetical protein